MANTYTLISSNVLGSSAASVTFSSIPSTYTDLVLRVSARADAGLISRNLTLTFNSDTATNYSLTYLYANDSSNIFSSRTSNAANINSLLDANGNSTTANVFSSAELYIPNYTVSLNKPVGSFSVTENNNTSNRIDINAGLWRNTATISSIQIGVATSGNLVAGSSFYLYGIKKN